MSHLVSTARQKFYHGIAPWLRFGFQGVSLDPAAEILLHRIQQNPNDCNAMLDLSIVLQILGHTEMGLEFQSHALEIGSLYRVGPSDLSDQPLRLLVLVGPGAIMSNIPIEFLVESESIQLEFLYLNKGPKPFEKLPSHDIAMVGICESDENRSLLHDVEPLFLNWPRPILNDPRSIQSLSRTRLGDCLEGGVSLLHARSTRIFREQLQSQEFLEGLFQGDLGNWIIRPTDSHAGHGLELFTNPSELRHYLDRRKEEEFFVAPFIEYQSSDGWYRKYRIAMIDGNPFPVHMAISKHWMVHYLNADMLNNQHNRDEEKHFFEHFSTEFGARHRRTLNDISERIGLDYVVFDCAETVSKEFVLFEADHGAVVHDMDREDLFPYKPQAMRSIFEAFHRMLQSKGEASRISRAA